MDLVVFLKGFAIGFAIAAPVGPIGLLCMQRTLAYGRLSGLLTGLGAATADAIYGMVAAFGLTVISNFLVGQQFWFKLIGGLFLLYLAIKTFFSPVAEKSATERHLGLLSDYTSTIFLTLTNPATILSFVAVFAGLGLASVTSEGASAILMVAGVFIGSACWWLILSGAVSLLSSRLNASSLKIVNRVAGSVILIFGITALASLFA